MMIARKGSLEIGCAGALGNAFSEKLHVESFFRLVSELRKVLRTDRAILKVHGFIVAAPALHSLYIYFMSMRNSVFDIVLLLMGMVRYGMRGQCRFCKYLL